MRQIENFTQKYHYNLIFKLTYIPFKGDALFNPIYGQKSRHLLYFDYNGPTGLPADKGQRDLFLINAMESALQEGHSREYQQMMKHYFRGLQNESEQSNE